MISFGTGGWRAEIGKDFYIGNIRRLAQALDPRGQNGFWRSMRYPTSGLNQPEFPI